MCIQGAFTGAALHLVVQLLRLLCIQAEVLLLLLLLFARCDVCCFAGASAAQLAAPAAGGQALPGLPAAGSTLQHCWLAGLARLWVL
jgi:hypothetical protein